MTEIVDVPQGSECDECRQSGQYPLEDTALLLFI